jgi:hypothetical protein
MLFVSYPCPYYIYFIPKSLLVTINVNLMLHFYIIKKFYNFKKSKLMSHI